MKGMKKGAGGCKPMATGELPTYKALNQGKSGGKGIKSGGRKK